VRDALGQPSEKLAGNILSRWLVLGHRTTR
jgi:hypothetical protein